MHKQALILHIILDLEVLDNRYYKLAAEDGHAAADLAKPDLSRSIYF
jgi:hypothetical protein